MRETPLSPSGPGRRKPLTQRQTQVLECIRAYVGSHGRAPTLRGIADHLGLRSESAVHAHIVALQQAGYLHRVAHEPRGIYLSEPVEPGALESVEVRFLRTEFGTGSRRHRLHAAGAHHPLPLSSQYVVVDPLMLGGATDDDPLLAVRADDDGMAGAHVIRGDVVITRRSSTLRPGAWIVVLHEDRVVVRVADVVGTRTVLRPQGRGYRRLDPDDDNVLVIGRALLVLRAVPAVSVGSSGPR